MCTGCQSKDFRERPEKVLDEVRLIQYKGTCTGCQSKDFRERPEKVLDEVRLIQYKGTCTGCQSKDFRERPEKVLDEVRLIQYKECVQGIQSKVALPYLVALSQSGPRFIDASCIRLGTSENFAYAGMLDHYKGMLSVYRGMPRTRKTRGIKENTQPFTEKYAPRVLTVHAAWYLKNKKNKGDYHDYCSDFLCASRDIQPASRARLAGYAQIYRAPM